MKVPMNTRKLSSLARRLAALFAGTVVAFSASSALAEGVHVVAPGETLSGIADHYGVSEAAITAVNGIEDPHLIIAGSKLSIPTGASVGGQAVTGGYRVNAGDTLSHIAQKFGVTVSALMAVNNLTSADHIYEGEVLNLPQSSYVAPSTLSKADARECLVDAAYEFGIALDLVLAVAWQESGWQQHVVSGVGATGLMQLMPGTAAWAIDDLGVDGAEDWRTNACSNARLGAAVLGALIDQAGGDGRTGLAFYVQGWYSIELNGWFDETKSYVTNVMLLREDFR